MCRISLDSSLREICVRTQILNALKSHTVCAPIRSFSLYFYENVYSQYKTEPITLLQIESIMGYTKIYLSVQKQSGIHVQYSENHLQKSMRILF